ncbi:FMN-binding negative transcriptional regulator [Niveispirillum sp. KHB5.9]|uniref:FMN-binding negative transcriptional regulator n=1 Tax=Niveispirillum sp. KHB5.9 TaxID=3400269 RepID=UPI003A8660AD
MSTIFETYSAADIRHLIEQHPLAWVMTKDGEEASLLPLVGVYDEEGGLTELIGHFARSNPLNAAFARDPRAVILFRGPQSYVSPSHAGRRDWGPTWNYAQLRVWANISVEEGLTAPSLDLLAVQVERDMAQPWVPSELGPRYDQLIKHIVGFRARVTRTSAKFKLGQDERPDTLRSILANMPDKDLAGWMRRFNPGRFEEGSDV